MAPRKTPEFRKMVVDEAIREGNNLKVAKKHGVCESTVRTWIQKSGRQEEARRLNPRSQMVASRQGAPPTRRVPTASRQRTPFHLVVDNGVLEFINRKRSEVGYTFTRRKLQDEALRIATEKEIEGFMASIGWWNGFRSRNGISRELLNNGAPAENEDEPLEVDPPVAEAENEDEPLEVDPPVAEVEDSQSDQAILPEGEPSGQSAGERGGVPEVENFHEVAQKSGDVLEGILNLQERYDPVWLPIASEEEEGILDQFDQVIALSPEALENISISELETTLVDPLWPPLPSSSPPWCAGYFLVENSIF